MRIALLSRLAYLLLPAALLAGCGGGGGGAVPTASTQNATTPRTLRPAEITPNDLHAGGGPFGVYAYSNNFQPVGLARNGFQQLPSPISLFGVAPTIGNIYYCETGSDFGVSVFDGVNSSATTNACAALGAAATGFGSRLDPPDFAGSDIAFSASNYASYKQFRETTSGEPVEIPMVAGPIDFGYNHGDLTGLTGSLQLSRWTYCAIANGTVTNWNDPAITQDNGGVSVTGGTSLPITFVYRSDADGTNLTIQRHFAVVCGDDWNAPYNSAPYQTATRNAKWNGGKPTENWTGPTSANFVAANGPDAQINAIRATTGAVGDVEGPLAIARQLSAALLQNQKGAFEDPTNVQTVVQGVATALPLPGLSDGGAIPSSQAKCIAYVSPVSYVDPLASQAYPIVEVSYGLFYSKNNAHFADVKTLVNYIDANSGSSPAAGTSDSVVEQQGYAPMPALVKTYLNSVMTTTTNGSTPCIQS